MQVFVGSCHNRSSSCVCMFACHMQSELRRVEVSVTGVGSSGEGAVAGCMAAGGGGNVCVCVFGEGCYLPALNKSPM